MCKKKEEKGDMRMARNKWSMENRNKLKFLLDEGFTVTKVAELMEMSYVTVLGEVKRGLEPNEYDEKRWVKYEPKKAVLYELNEQYGEEGVIELKEMFAEE